MLPPVLEGVGVADGIAVGNAVGVDVGVTGFCVGNGVGVWFFTVQPSVMKAAPVRIMTRIARTFRFILFTSKLIGPHYPWVLELPFSSPRMVLSSLDAAARLFQTSPFWDPV
jgi:hypothetical protein